MLYPLSYEGGAITLDRAGPLPNSIGPGRAAGSWQATGSGAEGSRR